MNKHDLAAARRSLLEHWLGLIQDAYNHQQRELDDLLHSRTDDEPVTTPKLQISMPSKDMMNLLLNGISAVLDGKGNPFGIEPPAKGIKPLKTRMQMILIVGELIDEIERLTAAGRPNPKTEAVSNLAAHHGLSVPTLLKAYKDKDLRGIATFRLNPLWARAIKKMQIK